MKDRLMYFSIGIYAFLVERLVRVSALVRDRLGQDRPAYQDAVLAMDSPYGSPPGAGMAAFRARFVQFLAKGIESAWWRRPDLLADLGLVLLIAVVGIALFRLPAGSGDYGQWLMLSRHYLGLDVPLYRDASSVPPVMPALLAGLQVVISDPLQAIQVFKALLGASFVLSFYLAGAGLFQSRTAGVVAAVCAFLVTDRMLEMFAFGGLPQIVSLTCLNLGIAAFGQAGARSGLRRRWWVLGSGGIALAMLSHAGTGVIAFLVAGAVAGISALRVRDVTLSMRVQALAPLAVTAVIMGVYWAATVLPLNLDYVQNPASLSYRGPDRVWALLQAYPPTMVLLYAGAVTVLVGTAYELFHRRLGAYAVLAGWALAAWGFFALSAFMGAATDFPRFVPPILAPFAVAVGGSVAVLFKELVGFLRPGLHTLGRTALPLGAGVLLALSLGPQTLARHATEAAFYTTPSLPDIQAAASLLAAALPPDAVILADTKEGKWIEGFSGRTSLFSIPTRYSFRTVERGRSIAAETLLRSTSALTNERFFVKYVDGKKTDAGQTVPRQPWIAVNHQGEYVDLVRFVPTESAVLATEEAGGGVLATLNALKAVTVDVQTHPDSIVLRTQWDGERRGGGIVYTQSVRLDKGSASMEVLDVAEGSAPMRGLEALLRPTPGVVIESIEMSEGGADITFPLLGSAQPRLRIEAIGQDISFQVRSEGLLLRSTSEARLHIRVTALTAGAPISTLDYVSPSNLVERYNVGAVVLQEGPSLEARVNRLSAIGFVSSQRVGRYMVLLRDGGEVSIPSTASSTDGTQTVGVSGQPAAGSAPAPSATPPPTPTPAPLPTVQSESDLAKVADWLAANAQGDALLLVPALDEAEWLRRTRSLETIVNIPVGAAMTPIGRLKSIIAETLLRTSATILNEDIMVKYVDRKANAAGEDVPRQPWIGVNHQGGYVDLLRLLPTESSILAADRAGGGVLATLNALNAVETTVVQSDGSLQITTVWSGERRGGTVTYRRTLRLERDSKVLDMIDVVESTVPLHGVEVLVRPVAGMEITSVAGTPSEMELTFSAAAGSAPRIRVGAVGAYGELGSRDGALATSSMGAVLHLRFTPLTTGERIQPLELFSPKQVVEDFNIRTALLAQGPSFASRKSRLEALGFSTVLEQGPYVVLQRQGAIKETAQPDSTSGGMEQ